MFKKMNTLQLKSATSDAVNMIVNTPGLKEHADYWLTMAQLTNNMLTSKPSTVPLVNAVHLIEQVHTVGMAKMAASEIEKGAYYVR